MKHGLYTDIFKYIEKWRTAKDGRFLRRNFDQTLTINHTCRVQNFRPIGGLVVEYQRSEFFAPDSRAATRTSGRLSRMRFLQRFGTIQTRFGTLANEAPSVTKQNR